MFFKITETEIGIQGLKEVTRIVQLADLHYSSKWSSYHLELLYEKIMRLSPRYICLVGDTIDRISSLLDEKICKQLEDWLCQLAVVPTLISLGSHDFKQQGYDSQMALDFWLNLASKSPNIHILHNATYEDSNLQFLGYTQPASYYEAPRENVAIMLEDLALVELSSQLKSDKPNIGLIHSPLWLNEEKLRPLLQGYQLILAGHMHNGMVPPGLDELWSGHMGLIEPNKKILAKNARGLLTVSQSNNEDSWINITGGVVKIAASAPRMLQPCNVIYPASIDQLNLLPAEKNKIYSRHYHYER